MIGTKLKKKERKTGILTSKESINTDYRKAGTFADDASLTL